MNSILYDIIVYTSISEGNWYFFIRRDKYDSSRHRALHNVACDILTRRLLYTRFFFVYKVHCTRMLYYIMNHERPPRYATTTVIDSFADRARTLFMSVTRDYNQKSKCRVIIIIIIILHDPYTIRT